LDECKPLAAGAILELLASPQSLKKFHLDKNMTGDEGTVHVAALLAKAPRMEDFKMAGRGLTSSTFQLNLSRF
jgi:hypothetical protein